jgi:uncharacterized protein YlxP (DUF503 family)
MHVGVCKIRLRIPENLSLKGKRQAVRPVIARVKNKFEVSIAEVEDQDLWQIATLGIAVVSNDGRHAQEVLSHVVDFIVNGHFDVEVLDYETEDIPV